MHANADGPLPSDPVEAFIPLLPSSKGNSKRIVNFGARKALIGSPEAIEAEKTLVALAVPHAPPVPLDGPLRLDVSFVMPIPTGFPEWKRAAALAGNVWPTVRPDRGNLLKLLEDALQKAGWYADDARVVAGEVGKSYGERPGYWLRLTRLVEAQKPAREPKAPKRKKSTEGAMLDGSGAPQVVGVPQEDYPPKQPAAPPSSLPPPEAMNGYADQFPGTDEGSHYDKP